MAKNRETWKAMESEYAKTATATSVDRKLNSPHKSEDISKLCVCTSSGAAPIEDDLRNQRNITSYEMLDESWSPGGTKEGTALTRKLCEQKKRPACHGRG